MKSEIVEGRLSGLKHPKLTVNICKNVYVIVQGVLKVRDAFALSVILITIIDKNTEKFRNPYQCIFSMVCTALTFHSNTPVVFPRDPHLWMRTPLSNFHFSELYRLDHSNNISLENSESDVLLSMH